MKLANGITLTLNEKNVIAALAAGAEAADGLVSFSTSKEFTSIVTDMPMSRMVEIWNNLAPRVGLKPVSKFENRQIATVRIWRALEQLATAVSAGVAPTAEKSFAEEALEEHASDTSITAPTEIAACAAPKSKGKKAANAKPAKDASELKAPREGTAKATVIAMLERKDGATLQEIMTATGWQAHTCRAFISTLPKKTDIKITSSKREDGARVYAATK